MSELYMTTDEFAELVIQVLHEQNFFSRNTKYHPEDICYAFVTVAETVGKTMSWAISKSHV